MGKNLLQALFENSDTDSDVNEEDYSLVPEQSQCRIGTVDYLTFGNVNFKIVEDTSKGCGGKIWESASVIVNHILHVSKLQPNFFQNKNFLEVGAGTGMAGLVLAQTAANLNQQCCVAITDLEYCLSIIQTNLELNLDENGKKNCLINELKWGLEIPKILDKSYDYILAADCVYLESLFDLLIQTFKDLCPINSKTQIILVSKKRRRADKKFLVKLKKFFYVEEVY
ncbi:hypothetical protein HK099_006683 [Clydaea vesicula]|uniref:Uncharacterized protein n=1 Tax=Clydaea vesicula TaxID=447962 RepID=A0AAD5XU45_9FUNG|nr:hypothetical protein HK099_006683 [Clydaea vesicula]